MLLYDSNNKEEHGGKGVLVMYGSNVMTAEYSISRSIYLCFKRLFDIVVSLIGLIVLSPLFLFVIIAIRLESKGKAIFVQDRIGLDGKTFKFYKFRSMIQDADKVLFEMLENDPKVREEYSINKKLVNDPRITKVGKFIRKTSIDELPQLINVLKGDMSLIGNRPYLPREKADMGIFYDDIVKSKPGLTGLWQVSGRSNTTFKTRLKIEANYSRDMCFKTDVKIFFKTFIVVLKGL